MWFTLQGNQNKQNVLLKGWLHRKVNSPTARPRQNETAEICRAQIQALFRCVRRRQVYAMQRAAGLPVLLPSCIPTSSVPRHGPAYRHCMQCVVAPACKEFNVCSCHLCLQRLNVMNVCYQIYWKGLESDCYKGLSFVPVSRIHSTNLLNEMTK